VRKLQNESNGQGVILPLRRRMSTHLPQVTPPWNSMVDVWKKGDDSLFSGICVCFETL